MTSKANKQQDNSIELEVTIPWATIADKYEEAVVEAVNNAELPGFRKGKAPRNLVEEKLDKGNVYEDVLKHLIPEIYNAAIKEQNLKPVVNPKVELKEATENKDWVIHFHTAEKPQVTLGDYKAKIQEVKAAKGKKIWLPGETPKPEEEGKVAKASMDDILKAVFEAIKIALPQLLIDNEINRLLSELIDQTKKLGITVEQYLASTSRTSETLRAEFATQAQRTLALEFALEDIADKEGILVTDDEISEVLKNAKSEDERKALEAQRYMLTTFLRRQKTLDFLASV